MTRVLLASANPGKLAEMRRILAAYVPHVEVLGLGDVEQTLWNEGEPAETEPTFEGNALVKARAAVRATGLPSLADDSGLCVDALNGMPGVLSARWSGTSRAGAPGDVTGGGGRADIDLANNTLLLAQLDDVPDERRGAQFRCAVAFAWPAPGGSRLEAHVDVRVVHGVVSGSIIREMRGADGFGYDVLFVADGQDRTTAELPPDEKDAISHRGMALREVAPVVSGVLNGLPTGGRPTP